MKKAIIFIVLLLSWTVCFSAQSFDLKSRPLAGIEAIGVVIENLDDDAKKMGLTETQVRTVAELMIRREGIRIDNNIPTYLYINFNVLDSGSYSLSLEFKEYVTLVRDPTISCIATTWDTGSVGFSRQPDFIIDALRKYIEDFLNDYYKANPKK